MLHCVLLKVKITKAQITHLGDYASSNIIVDRIK